MSGVELSELYRGQAGEDDRIFGRSLYGDFLNWGYWHWDTADQLEACHNLVELVLAQSPRSGNAVLEVGCGIGGVSRRLARDYAQVTGINIAPDQLARCRELVPGATFVQMDATALQFEANRFDDVVSIEAAMHFDTRERFFAEAHRVLRPGGRLLLADIIAVPQLAHSEVGNVAEYTRALERAGFVEVRVIDVTRDVRDAHLAYCMWHLRELLDRGTIDQRRFDLAAIGRVARLAATSHYVVASARKRLEHAPAWRMAPHTSEFLGSLLISTAGA